MANRINILVTGGEGMLGSALAGQAVHFPHFNVRALGRATLDVRDLQAVTAQKDWVRGGWIIHCAALVNVEGCARDPEAARATIVAGTQHIVDLAAAAGARLAYPQSFLVYDGASNPIAEDETPRPLSFYGALKYEAEQLAEAALAEALIIRMAGFFGGGARDKNFVGRIIPAMHAAMLRGETRFEVGTRVWQPSWTDDLAFNTLHMIARGCAGRYQMACQDAGSFAEIADEIVQALGWQNRLEIVAVDPAAVTTDELGRRPDAAVLSCARLTAERLNLQRYWRPTLHAYLQTEFFDRYRLEPGS
jgi:dTDP-4-dehydrorhamnose reductase